MLKLWFNPAAAVVGLALAAAVVVLNFASLSFGADVAWLPVATTTANLLVLAAMIVVIVQTSLEAEKAQSSARSALDDSQARLAAVMDSAMDGIVAIDENQRIVLFNQAAESIFRCPRGEAIGRSLERFLPARFRGAHADHIRRFGETGVTNRRMGDATTLWALRADGVEFPIEASISQAKEGGHRLFTVILRDITRRKQYEDMLARRQAELHEISARVLEAREEEKTLLARELHDELGQLLTAAKMDLAWLRQRLPPGTPELEAKAAQLEAVLDRTVGSVRRISAELRPLMLDDLGLRDAIGWLAKEFEKHSGVACHVTAADETALENVDRSVAITLYRVLQESLTNVGRHAQAKNAWVVLTVVGNWLHLEVEDDGRGIAEADLARPRSLGLKGMRERVRYLGGVLEVGRAPRGGTRVLVQVQRLASTPGGTAAAPGSAA
jgi:two-component system sensor kinase